MVKILEIENLQTQFFTSAGTVRAVDGITYTVNRGETVAIVGESGCGKSVSALSILRLIPDPPGRVVGGSIRFMGMDILALSDAEIRKVRGRRIAMVFQEPMTSLNPVLTIGRQLTETLEHHLGMAREAANARAAELLGMVGISDPERRLTQYPHHLSGGMRQRVMIAMALSCEPELIIADEPTTALDVTIQAQILELMRDLTKRLGVALIIITHNLGVVARYADRVNVMYAGKIIEQGSALQIYHQPSHPYTLGLLKSVPRLDQPRKEKLDPIEGQPPDLTRLGAGCAFRPRCRYAVERCANEIPALEPVGDWGGIVVMGCVERLESGHYMALFHDDGRFIRGGPGHEDGGRPFRPPSAGPGARKTARPSRLCPLTSSRRSGLGGPSKRWWSPAPGPGAAPHLTAADDEHGNPGRGRHRGRSRRRSRRGRGG